MTAKKSATPAQVIEDAKTMESMVGADKTETGIPEAELMQIEIDALKCENEALAHENANLLSQLSSADTPTIDIKTQMLMSLVPNFEIHHAKTRAQQALIAVDEIMKVWGME